MFSLLKGVGEQRSKVAASLSPQFPCPMPNAQFPIPNSQFPLPTTSAILKAVTELATEH
ncbi:MAG: hypothetical protein V7K36_28875 [Nostoc sp.]